MSSVAFLLQPLEISHFYAILGPFEKIARRIINEQVAKLIIRVFPSFKLTTVNGITSELGKDIDAHLIICPLLPEHIISLNRKVVLRKINKAIRIAKRAGAELVELSSFISLVENDWEDISSKLGIALTTGENFLAGSVLKQLSIAASMMDLPMGKSCLLVISPSNPIGSLCAKLLSQAVKKIIIFGKTNEVLDDCKIWLKKNSSVEFEHNKDLNDASRQADIILITTHSLTTDLNPLALKSGMILCDIGIPPLIAQEVSKKRNDILAFDGRLIELPQCNFIENKHWRSLFPKKGLLVFARLAESLVLGFETILENYSLATHTLTPERAKEVFDLGERHGFKITPFRNKDIIMNVDEIKKSCLSQIPFRVHKG